MVSDTETHIYKKTTTFKSHHITKFLIITLNVATELENSMQCTHAVS